LASDSNNEKDLGRAEKEERKTSDKAEAW